MAYYVIKWQGTNFVLDASGGGKDGHKVITYDRNDHDNQVWYDDPITNTIRLKDGHFVMAIKNNELIVQKYVEGNLDQKWKRHEKYIRNVSDNNKVLDVLDESKDKGAKIGAWGFHGKRNQCFEFIFVGGEAPVTAPQPGGVRRQFHIVSEMNGRVLDISGAKKDPGAKLVMWDKKAPDAPNQLWYIDTYGYMRSVLNDMTFNNDKKGEVLKMQIATGDPRNQWTFHGRKVGNRAGECLDIKKEDKDNGADVCSFEYKDTENQHWIQQYV